MKSHNSLHFRPQVKQKQKQKKTIQSLTEQKSFVFRSRINPSIMGHLSFLLKDLPSTIVPLLYNVRHYKLIFYYMLLQSLFHFMRVSKSNSDAKSPLFHQEKILPWADPIALQNLPTSGAEQLQAHLSKTQQLPYRDACAHLSVPKGIQFQRGHSVREHQVSTHTVTAQPPVAPSRAGSAQQRKSQGVQSKGCTPVLS